MRISLLALAALAAAPAAAKTPLIMAGNDLPECTCRSRGANLALGSQICIPTPDGMKMAECVMEQNVTSWRASAVPCPQARLQNASPRMAN